VKRLPQASAVPCRRGEDGPLFLLITNRKGQWILPKGIIDPGETAEETALKEAFEEAGVRGTIAGAAIARYTYEKWDCLCEVEAFLLLVEREEPDWPESEVRDRAWFRPAEARAAVKRKLAAVLESAEEALRILPNPPAGSSSPAR
jgi:8-oxo-dGTP pyrophosphatase MutT (NUDIX family)